MLPPTPHRQDIAKRKHVGLLAGGSGLTPMLQVAEEALRQKLPIKVGGGRSVGAVSGAALKERTQGAGTVGPSGGLGWAEAGVPRPGPHCA